MVKAGGPVDAVIENLIPLLDKGDIIIDGGNSLYTDTERRDKWLGDLGFRFIGAGVSGGEEGARKGPSIMFRDLAKREDRALLIVTHDPKVRTIADRVVRIRDGRIEA